MVSVMTLDRQDEELRRLAVSLRRLMELTHTVLEPDGPRAEAVARVSDHLGVPLGEVGAVSQSWPPYEHANLQRAVDAYLGPDADWFGVTGSMGPPGEEFLALLSGRRGDLQLGRATYGTAAVRPQEST